MQFIRLELWNVIYSLRHGNNLHMNKSLSNNIIEINEMII